MEFLIIEKLIPKGDGKNFYGYDHQGNAHDIQKTLYNWSGDVFMWFSTFRGKQRIKFTTPPIECEKTTSFIPNTSVRRIV